MNLEDYILVIDNSLEKDICDKLISFFDKNTELHNRYDSVGPKFTQINFTQNLIQDKQLHDQLLPIVGLAVNTYMNCVDESKYWEKGYKFEQLRIKCYNNNNYDQFHDHIDSSNLKDCIRFLAFFWYLNDIDEGEETEFTNIGFKVKPKTGRLVMFPPNWMFPHCGHPPISDKKYLLSSYLHFGN